MTDATSGLLRSSAVMAAGTVVSRLTGFVRGAMLAAAIGLTGLHPDIFTLANTVPNMLYILVAGGIFNAVLVPQIVRATKSDADGGAAYVNRILTLSGLFLAGVTAVLVAAAPWVMRLLTDDTLFAPGIEEQTESFITFARYCLPQVFFYGVFVLIGQVLNARGRFGPMMWAPIANNLVAVAVLGAYLVVFGPTADKDAAYTNGQELLLGLGSTLGIVVQTVVLLPYLRAAGVHYRPRFDFRDTGLGHTLRLAVWTVLFVVVNQVAYVVVIKISSNAVAAATLDNAASAGITVYTQAFLVLMVPHAIITVSLATAILPRLSDLSAGDDHAAMRSEIATTLRHALAVIVPFGVLLTVLAPFLAALLFGFGTARGDTDPLALTLVAFVPGLLFFTVHYLMLRGFYSLEDTRTPFVVQLVVAGTNMAAALGITAAADTYIVAPLLALAYGCAYLVGSMVSAAVLGRRIGGSPVTGVVGHVGKLALAAIPAGAAALLVVILATWLGIDRTVWGQSLLVLSVAAAVALPVFWLLSHFLRIPEVTSIMTTVFGRLRTGGTSR